MIDKLFAACLPAFLKGYHEAVASFGPAAVGVVIGLMLGWWLT